MANVKIKMLRDRFIKGKFAGIGTTVTTDEVTAARLIGARTAIPVGMKAQKPDERDTETSKKTNKRGSEDGDETPTASGLTTKNSGGALVPGK